MCVCGCGGRGGEGGNVHVYQMCKVQRSRYKVHNVSVLASNLAFFTAEVEKLKMSSSSSSSPNSPPPPLLDLLGFGWGLGGCSEYVSMCACVCPLAPSKVWFV